MNSIPYRGAVIDGFAPQGAAELDDLIAKCCASGVARNALLLAVKRLPAHLTKAHHLRLTNEALDPLCSADRARVFTLADGSRAVIWRGDAGPLLEHVINTLRHLLADEVEVSDLASIASLYTLPRDADRLRSAIRETMPAAIAPIRRADKARERLDPPSLQSLEQSLAQVNVSRFARHRRLWRVALDGKLEPAWDKRFLAVAELTEILLPERDAAADPWLYRRLTRTLDRRLLSLLAAPDELRASGPLSLDLNVGTLLAPEFLRFDAALPPHLRGNMVIDLLAADIVADAASYLFARGFVRARRYRLMIREVSKPLLAALDFKALDPDLVEIEYNPSLALNPELLPTGPELVLAYPNHSGQVDMAARNFGREHGIRLLSPRD